MRMGGIENFLILAYHDKEWGKPVKKVFMEFDAEKLSRLTYKQLEALLKNPEIIRNRLKVYSFRTNARAYLEVRKEFGNFSKYLWSFVEGQPIKNKWKKLSQVPATTPESDAMSKDLKKRGFEFVGSTICYALMQATGMVNDHTVDCFRYSLK